MEDQQINGYLIYKKTIWIDEVVDDNGRLALFVGKFGLDPWLDGSILETLQVKNGETKNPSPARLYRIALSARTFWENVLADAKQELTNNMNYRLLLTPEASFDRRNVGRSHTYELRCEQLSLKVSWDGINNRFVTTENLYRLQTSLTKSKNALINLVASTRFKIYEASEFGKQSNMLNPVDFTVDVSESDDKYHQCISLLTEPSIIMLLMPANKALDLAKKVTAKYEKEMGKVRDRLPIGIGLVFSTSRTPVRAMIEAGRSMLTMINENRWEDWLIDDYKNENTTTSVQFDNGVVWNTQITATLEPDVQDCCYPRVYTTCRCQDGFENATIVSISDEALADRSKPWKIWVRPSFFDFEYLDTSSRRFEIQYGTNGRRLRKTKPFYIEDLKRFENIWELMGRLKKTQRYQIVQTIESTRELWYGNDREQISLNDPVFKQFVTDTLGNAEWPTGNAWNTLEYEQKNSLSTAGVTGELADLAELHLQILKEQ